MRDNGLNVIVGVRRGRSYDKAVSEGWIPGKTLFSISEASEKGTIIMNLLSDASQKETWPEVKKHLTKGKTLYFSHGFSIVYKDQTNVVPPADIDVILVAPKVCILFKHFFFSPSFPSFHFQIAKRFFFFFKKNLTHYIFTILQGSGFTARRLFLEGRGINSSYAVFQDASGNAKERAIALGVGIGSGYLYETTFSKEVYSDLFGERGILMGAIQGMFVAQYEVLRAHGT